MHSIQFILIIILVSFSLSSNAKEVALWSEAIFDNIEKEYGKAGAQRMKKVYKIMGEAKGKSIREKLEIANNTLNSLPWISDKKKWNKGDYWATPMETITTYGGDCEDMALGKMMMLYFMGIPKKNLFLGHVRLKKTNESHMIMVWFNDSHSEALVLDNIDKKIKPGKQRTDLLGLYLTDWDGNVLVLEDDGKRRKIITRIEQKKLKKLEDLKKRSRANMKKYIKLNGGQPLVKSLN